MLCVQTEQRDLINIQDTAVGSVDSASLHQVMRWSFDPAGLIRIVPHISQKRTGM
jgi:hypothetical protein